MATTLLRHLSLLRRFLLPAALLLFAAQAHAGLIGYWNFDETSGTSAADSSGNGYTGTLTNMTGSEWTTGKVGGALDFDGTNDYVDLGDYLANTRYWGIHTWSNNLGDVTLSAWIYNEGGNSGYSMIFAKEKIIAFAVRDDVDKLAFNFGSGGSWGSATESGSEIPMNQWVHVAGVRSGSTVTVYIDGVLEGTGTNANTGNNGASAGIGNRPSYYGSGSRCFNGLLDDIRYYDHALSASEVSALAGVGGAGAPEPAETFAFLGLLTACGLGYREWRSRRQAKAV